MTYKYVVMAGFDRRAERVALTCDSNIELRKIIERLNKSFTLIETNLWQDSFGQQFSIKRVEAL